MRLGLLIADAFLFIFLMSVFTISHEATHKYIAEQNGCKAKMHLNPFSEVNHEEGIFVCTTWDCDNLTVDQYNQVENQENNVEAVGYQIMPGYVILVLIFILLLHRGKKNRKISRL